MIIEQPIYRKDLAILYRSQEKEARRLKIPVWNVKGRYISIPILIATACVCCSIADHDIDVTSIDVSEFLDRVKGGTLPADIVAHLKSRAPAPTPSVPQAKSRTPANYCDEDLSDALEQLHSGGADDHTHVSCIDRD